MPPTAKKLTWHIGFGLSVHLSRTVHARVLKFHIWIPHGIFFFLSELSPSLELCPFEKIGMKSYAWHILRNMHARVLKFHIWIPHGKIAETLFFILVRVISLSGVMHLWKNHNEIWCKPYLMKRACKGFEFSYMDSSWKNSWPIFIFLFVLSPFLELCVFEKKSEWNLVSKMSRKVFELGAWNLVSW